MAVTVRDRLPASTDMTLRSFSKRRPSGTPDVENIDDRTVWHPAAGTLRNCFCEQPFELPQIGDLGANIIKMVCGDFANIGAGRISRRSQIEQSADVIEAKSQLAGSPDKSQGAHLCRPINPMAPLGAARVAS
jgi:hypothetical protein